MGFVDDVIMGEPGSSKIDISALVIDLSEQLPDPQPIVRIWGNLIASRGNVSTVVGLAKAGRPFDRCRGFGISLLVGFSRLRYACYR